MKESLKRDLNKTYLVLSAEDEVYEESYELEMIMKNAPQTILPLRVMRMDGRLEISYDISSKQTLREFMVRGNLPGSMVRELFSQIVLLGEDMKNYLLDIGCVMLDPEHIYRKEEAFYFCYCPWEKRESTKMLKELLEELLGKLDYGDAQGIELAYHLYQSACSGDFDIRKILREHTHTAEEKIYEEKEPVFLHEKPPEEPPEPEPALWGMPEEEKPAKKQEKEEKKPGILERLKQFFLKKEEPEEKEQKAEYPDAWEEINKLRIPGEEENFCIAEPQAAYEAKSSVGAEGGESENPTVLLKNNESTTLLRNAQGGAWRLRPLLQGYEEFRVEGESFLVGKNREIVDGYIGRETISRIHSRLYVKEDRLYIADANSTNGTFVNGDALLPGTDTEIFCGDRVMFADVGYECYNSL